MSGHASTYKDIQGSSGGMCQEIWGRYEVWGLGFSFPQTNIELQERPLNPNLHNFLAGYHIGDTTQHGNNMLHAPYTFKESMLVWERKSFRLVSREWRKGAP